MHGRQNTHAFVHAPCQRSWANAFSQLREPPGSLIVCERHGKNLLRPEQRARLQPLFYSSLLLQKANQRTMPVEVGNTMQT